MVENVFRTIHCPPSFPLQPAPFSRFFRGYVGAVTSAVSIAVSSHNSFGLTRLRWWRTAFARIIISKLCCKSVCLSESAWRFKSLWQENDQIQLKPFITNLISSTPPPPPLCYQMSKGSNSCWHAYLPDIVWAYRAEANYWSRWALIQLLPSGLTTAERTWGAWEAERRVGRGSGTLQLSLRWGDAPLLDRGGVGVLTGDHSYAFNCRPDVHYGVTAPWDLPWA